MPDWADYAELMCLLDEDSVYDLDRLVASREQGADDLGESGEASSPLIFVTDQPVDEVEFLADEAVEAEDIVEATEEDAEETSGLERAEGRSAEKFDNARNFGAEVFRYLNDRRRLLGELYPFDVSGSTISIRQSTDVASSGYVYLLCCANLRFFAKGTQSVLTRSFELYSFSVLRTLAPPGARLDCFGGAGGLRPSRFSGGNLFKRVKALAEELKCKFIADESDFSPFDNGDNGLDVVAWVPLDGSRAEGVFSMFGQCACGEWEGTKQLEAHDVRWRRFLAMPSPPTAVLFSPEMPRRIGGSWYATADVATLVFDRMRCLLSHEEVPRHPQVATALGALTS